MPGLIAERCKTTIIRFNLLTLALMMLDTRFSEYYEDEGSLSKGMCVDRPKDGRPKIKQN